MDSRGDHRRLPTDHSHSRFMLRSSGLLLLSLPLTIAQPLLLDYTALPDPSLLITSRSFTHKYSPRHPHLARALLPFQGTTSNPLHPRAEDGEDIQATAVNYYYAFIAIGVVLILFLVWSSRRRRRMRKAASLHRRQSALQQDASGWPTTRRFLHGRWQSGNNHEYYRQEEGLDARGEAPPPYQPGSGPAAVDQQQTGSDTFLAVPQATLTRDSPHKPPEYQATVRAVPEVPAMHDMNLDEGRSGSSSSMPTEPPAASPNLRDAR